MSEEKKQIPVRTEADQSIAVNPNDKKTKPRNNFSKKPFNKKPFNRNKQEKLFEEKVVSIRRVTKVTKGGRHFRFAAVVVIGDKKGKVGFGTGKANEVPDAIKKAIKVAQKDLISVPIVGTTIPHEIIGRFGAGRVLIKPAKKGKGVISGGPARSIMELSGLADVYTKSLGSNTPINMIRATLDGLKNLKTAQEISKLRNKNLEEF